MEEIYQINFLHAVLLNTTLTQKYLISTITTQRREPLCVTGKPQIMNAARNQYHCTMFLTLHNEPNCTMKSVCVLLMQKTIHKTDASQFKIIIVTTATILYFTFVIIDRKMVILIVWLPKPD